jgi:hypothetical protein
MFDRLYHRLRLKATLGASVMRVLCLVAVMKDLRCSLFAFIRVHLRLQAFPPFDNSGYATGRRHPTFAGIITNPMGSSHLASGQCATRQPHFRAKKEPSFCIRKRVRPQTHFRAKRKPIFFFHNEFLGVLKLMADWNPGL